MPEIRFKKLNPEAVIPKYQTSGAAGFDFHLLEDVNFLPQQILAIGTGLAAAVPAGFMLMLLPRSSAGVKFQLRLANTAGVVDSDYRGEIICVLQNNSANHFKFAKGDRLVQGILVPVPQHTILEVDDLDSTERGAGGFGSTNLPERQKPIMTTTQNNWLIPGKAVMSSNLVYDVRVVTSGYGDDDIVTGVKGLIHKMYLADGWHLDCLCIDHDGHVTLFTEELLQPNQTVPVSKIPLRVISFRPTI